MTDPLQFGLIAYSLALAVFAVVHVTMNRLPGWGLVGGLGLLEVGLLAQAVVAIVQLVTGDRAVETAVFLGYLIGILFVPPVAAVWALAERSRSGTAVLIVATVVVPVLIVRLQQTWDGIGVG